MYLFITKNTSIRSYYVFFSKCGRGSAIKNLIKKLPMSTIPLLEPPHDMPNRDQLFSSSMLLTFLKENPTKIIFFHM
jgi:hypothetical protein